MDMSPICSSDNEQLQPNQKVLCFMLLRVHLTLQSSLHFFPAVADSCIVEGYKLKRPAKIPHAITMFILQLLVVFFHFPIDQAEMS